MAARVRALFLGRCVGAIAVIAALACFVWAASINAAQREAGYRVYIGLADNSETTSMALRESGRAAAADSAEPPAGISESVPASSEYALSLASMPLMPVEVALSVVMPEGEPDPQQPHTEDEIYYVVSGAGRLRVGDEDRAVRTGSPAFVGAGVSHRFHSISEDLTLLVAFAPPRRRWHRELAVRGRAAVCRWEWDAPSASLPPAVNCWGKG